MPADPRGGWFRVYSRQVLHHDKFKSLSHAELGAWLDIRAAVDMLGGEPLPDRTEAILRLRRRTKNPGRLLDRLIEVRLLDELAGGGIAIHDLDEHDRRYPSDAPERVRARVQKHREEKRNDVTPPRRNDDETKPTRARLEAEADTESEAEPDPLRGLPSSDDPLTIICEIVMSSGPIDDKEFKAKVDGQTRRFGKEWTTAAYRQAAKDMLANGKRPRQWDLSRLAEVHLAGWTRAEELRQIEAQHQREEEERTARLSTVEEMAPEERERQELMRRAVGVWIRGGRKGKVPEGIEELRAWLEQNGEAA